MISKLYSTDIPNKSSLKPEYTCNLKNICTEKHDKENILKF